MESVSSRSRGQLSRQLPDESGGGSLVSGLWRGSQLERLMAGSGDVKNQGVVLKGQKQKRSRETGTNLVKMPLKVNKAVTAITWAPIRD